MHFVLSIPPVVPSNTIMNPPKTSRNSKSVVRKQNFRREARRILRVEQLEHRALLAVDSLPPTLISGVLANSNATVDVSEDLRMDFSEPIKRGSNGAIELYLGNGDLVESFDISTSPSLSFNGNQLSINPRWNLNGSSNYYITIDAGSILDMADNPFGGVQNNQTLVLRTDVETRNGFGSSFMLDEFPGTTSEAIGNHSALYIRATFTDLNRAPGSLEDAKKDMNTVSQFYSDNSQGRISFNTTYTPVVTLDYSHKWFTEYDQVVDGLSRIMHDATEKAKTIGFDASQFNVVVVRVDAGLRAGASWGGGNSAWLAWGGPTVAAHGFGHALGLGHSNSITWAATSDSQAVEYGNNIDNMGDGGVGAAHYINPKKDQLDWVDSANLLVNPGPGTYRLYASDSINYVSGNYVGWSQVIAADSIGTNPRINLEYRPAQGGEFEQSLVVYHNNLILKKTGGTQIDLGMTLGATYQIPGSNSFFTVVNQGDGYLDFKYFEGPFSTNTAPLAMFTASASTVKRFDTVTFVADAIDLQSDALVYRWTFSDGITGSGRTFQRSFNQSTSGNVTATLVVSDMRGGTKTLTTPIAVGASSTGNPITIGNIEPSGGTFPSVSIHALNAFSAEGSINAILNVKRTNSSNSDPLQVNLSYTGSAISDFEDLPTSITIPSGESSANLVLIPRNDQSIEATKSLNVSLATSNTYEISDQNSLLNLQLRDDDLPVISISAIDSQAVESNGGSRDTGLLRITRTGSVDLPMTVYYGLSGTAFNGSDFSRLNGQVTIPQGASDATILIDAKDDEVGETIETVILTIASFNDAYSVASNSRATVSIVDNQDAPVVSVVTSPSASHVTEGQSGKFNFTAIGGTGEDVVVNYTLRGTALHGDDFDVVSGSIVVPTGGLNTVSLDVFTIDDGLWEDDESVILTLTPSSGYTRGLDSNAQMTISDLLDYTIGDDKISVTAFNGEDQDYGIKPTEANSKPADFLIYRDSTHLSREALTVKFSLSGTATPGVDYLGEFRTPGTADNKEGSLLGSFNPLAMNNSVVIPSTAMGVVVRLIPIDDSLIEGTESIQLTLTSVTYSLPFGINSSANHSLLDNDRFTTEVGFQNVSSLLSESRNPSENIHQINVVLTDPAPAQGVLVHYKAGAGAAIGSGADWSFVDQNGNDLITPIGVLNFPQGSTTQSIRIKIQNDRIEENQEDFSITLDPIHGASLKSGNSKHTVTLFDSIPQGLVREERWEGVTPFSSTLWDNPNPNYVGYLLDLLHRGT